MKTKRVLARLWENRPNYKIVYLAKSVDRVDAEKFLNSLPLRFKFDVSDEVGSAPLLEVLVQGPSIEIFPPSGQEIRGIFFDQEGAGAVAARKIGVESIACEIEDVNTGKVFNESSTLRVKPCDLGVNSWVGLYDFQRHQHATEEVVIFIYKRPKGKW